MNKLMSTALTRLVVGRPWKWWRWS